MIRIRLIFALCFFWGMPALIYAQPGGGGSRGELLYATHCNACHTSKIHWREKRLVTDMDSLGIQVRRWQGNIGLKWTEEEIADVVSYLNATYYNFSEADRKVSPQGETSAQAPHKN